MIAARINDHGEYLIFALLLLCFGFLLLRQHLINRKPTYIATATILSRHTEPARYHGKWSSGWNYLVTFRLSDGDTLTLYTGEEAYYALEIGRTGTLHWQDKDFREFETND